MFFVGCLHFARDINEHVIKIYIFLNQAQVRSCVYAQLHVCADACMCTCKIENIKNEIK